MDLTGKKPSRLNYLNYTGNPSVADVRQDLALLVNSSDLPPSCIFCCLLFFQLRNLTRKKKLKKKRETTGEKEQT